jgi:RNA polymerase sigma-70 factor (ECF subfamily)
VDEQNAIQSLKQGDIRGLEWLVLRYQLKAIRVAYLITRDRFLAEEIVQEAFINAYTYIGSFDDRRPFEPWFMRSVVNASVKATQKEAKHAAPFPEEDKSRLEKVLIDGGLHPEDQIELSEFQSRVREAMAQLSPRQRSVVVLRYFLDMSEKEMSDELEIAPGTLKWLLYTAAIDCARLSCLLCSHWLSLPASTHTTV